MNVNGITGSIDGYSSFSNLTTDKEVTRTAAKVNETESIPSTPVANEGVVYEPSNETTTKTYKANEEVIARLKADADERVAQLRTLVEQLILKQNDAYAKATDMWNFLREGHFEVDAETKAQAEADIAEDGYWGVNQTSDRIIDFAMALTGGDPSKISAMKDAFKEGFAQAEKTWGGKLPELSQKTYDAVLEKFDKLMSENTETE